MVSLARPFLADPDWVRKAEQERAQDINTCIACNQACLDHIFQNKRASCLVNPFACYETELVLTPAVAERRVAVVGAGVAGLACATVAAERGHEVTLFEAQEQVGGQFNMARQIPGKEEFDETIRYYLRRVEQTGVTLKLGTRASADDLKDFDVVVIATGVVPRRPGIPGLDHPSVLTYPEVLWEKKPVGERVAIIGAGGIAVDTAKFLVIEHSAALDPDAFFVEWGIDRTLSARGGLVERQVPSPKRQVTICQRSSGKIGKGMGKTTGWVHRAELKARGVEVLSNVQYERVDDAGLHVRVDGQPQVLEVDTVVVCAGQVRNNSLHEELSARGGASVHIIGGAHEAAELDARRAIDQGTRLAVTL